MAEESASSPAEPQSAVIASRDVPTALAGLTFANGKPNMEARYYMYLFSASWCGPCVSLMPQIVAAYPEMKADGVEVILIGCDATPELMDEYLQRHGAAFSGVHVGDPGLKNLPGYIEAKAIPEVIVVDRAGDVVTINHGMIALEWRKIISEYEAKRK